MKERAIYFNVSKKMINRVYAEETKEKLRKELDISDEIYSKKDFGKVDFSDVKYIFTTWGMMKVNAKSVRTYFPNLKCLFYAAGTVKGFAKPFIQNGVRIFSGWKANAVPVAEYTFSQIILANKGFYQLLDRTKEDYAKAKQHFEHYVGNYNAKIGIIGYGSISSIVVDQLVRRKFEVYVCTDHMSKEKADSLGVKLASLDEIFENCDVISNHLANTEANHKRINAKLINKMKHYATFINTGRGQQVDEKALVAKCKKDKTITAVLDVTDPEPPLSDSPLYSVPNIFVTPHIAGSAGNEVCRMSEYICDEFLRYKNGEKTIYEIDAKMLETMA